MRKGYPTDLSDPQWKLLEPLIPPAGSGGRPRKQNMRRIIDAIFYVIRAGCSWQMLPKEFPPKSTVFYYFNNWREEGTWKLFNDSLREKVRVSDGRNAAPSAGVLDAQSVKASDCCESRGYDAGKKINGRKRHLLVETTGLVLLAIVHPGNVQDRDGAKLVLDQARAQFPILRKIWADGGYAGKLVEWVAQTCGWLLEIVKRSDKAMGFEVLPRRWVVERTFGWLMKYRRFSRDYEHYSQTGEAMIYAAMTHLMVRRLA